MEEIMFLGSLFHISSGICPHDIVATGTEAASATGIGYRPVVF